MKKGPWTLFRPLFQGQSTMRESNSPAHASRAERDEAALQLLGGSDFNRFVAMAIGAVLGGVTAGALGSAVAGAMGAALGAAVGAVTAAFAGIAMAASVDAQAEDPCFRDNDNTRPHVYAGVEFDGYDPASDPGVADYVRRLNRSFEQAESDLAREWARGEREWSKRPTDMCAGGGSQSAATGTSVSGNDGFGSGAGGGRCRRPGHHLGCVVEAGWLRGAFRDQRP